MSLPHQAEPDHRLPVRFWCAPGCPEIWCPLFWVGGNAGGRGGASWGKRGAVARSRPASRFGAQGVRGLKIRGSVAPVCVHLTGGGAVAAGKGFALVRVLTVPFPGRRPWLPRVAL